MTSSPVNYAYEHIELQFIGLMQTAYITTNFLYHSTKIQLHVKHFSFILCSISECDGYKHAYNFCMLYPITFLLHIQKDTTSIFKIKFEFRPTHDVIKGRGTCKIPTQKTSKYLKIGSRR